MAPGHQLRRMMGEDTLFSMPCRNISWTLKTSTASWILSVDWDRQKNDRGDKKCKRTQGNLEGKWLRASLHEQRGRDVWYISGEEHLRRVGVAPREKMGGWGMPVYVPLAVSPGYDHVAESEKRAREKVRT